MATGALLAAACGNDHASSQSDGEGASGAQTTGGSGSSQITGGNGSSSSRGGVGSSSAAGGSSALGGAAAMGGGGSGRGGDGGAGGSTAVTCGKNEALCNGHCFAQPGDAAAGCRLLVKPAQSANNFYGGYLPSVAAGTLYVVVAGQLEAVDLESLTRRPVYYATQVLSYAVADTFAIVADAQGLLRVELADGSAKRLASASGAGFILRGDTWYFSSGDKLATMPRAGGAVTVTSIPAATFALAGDSVYSEDGFSLAPDVLLTSLSAQANSLTLASYESSATVLQATDAGAYWVAAGKYHHYSASDASVTSLELDTAYPLRATQDSVVLVERDDKQHIDTFSVADLSLDGKRALASVSYAPQSQVVALTDTHLYVCTDNSAIFEVAR